MTGRLAPWLAAVLLLAAVIAPSVSAAGAPNPFGARAPVEAPGAVERAYRGLLLEIAQIQRGLNRKLAAKIAEIKDTGSVIPALTVLLVAFLYGVFHAAGPGHGKFIVTSYFLARNAPLTRGLLMSGLISFLQALSAILIVTILVMLLGQGRLAVLGQVVTLELVSYGLVVLLGLYMAWGALRGVDCDHGATAQSGHHDHDDSAISVPWYRRLGGMMPVAVAAGVRPCSGAIILLLFTMANGLYFLGVLGTFVMALGVAITVSIVGVLAIGTRRSIFRLTGEHGHARSWLLRGVGLVGSLLVALIGALLFLATWERLPGGFA
jgi:ABC-type nickel/cobalt efflux system permease component RcnA